MNSASLFFSATTPIPASRNRELNIWRTNPLATSLVYCPEGFFKLKKTYWLHDLPEEGVAERRGTSGEALLLLRISEKGGEG